MATSSRLCPTVAVVWIRSWSRSTNVIVTLEMKGQAVRQGWNGRNVGLDIKARAGVLVLGTRTRSTRVLNFWYSYFTRTREFQSNSTRTCTCGQVLRYSYEYWHEYWYSMAHLQCKDENHNTYEINSLTWKVTNWLILLWFEYDTWDVIANSITSVNSIIIEKLTELLLWCLCLLLSFVQVHFPIQLLVNVWNFLLQT